MIPSSCYRILRVAITSLPLVLGALPGLAQEAAHNRSPLSGEWRFTKGDPAGIQDKLSYDNVKAWILPTAGSLIKTGSAIQPRPIADPVGVIPWAQPDFNDAGWRTVSVPHDWGIEGPFKQEYPADTGKLPWWGTAWYRRHFTVGEGEGKACFIDFDGAMSHAMVWVNGKFAGGWPYGYASWRIDATPFVHAGDNVVAVRLDNPEHSSRWYPGGGICRNVWLVTTSTVHLAHWGVFVTTPQIDASAATVQVQASVDNAASSGAKIVTQVYAAGAQGEPVGRLLAESQLASVPADGAVKLGLSLPTPTLWSVDKPCLYVAVTSLLQNNRLLDQARTQFGVRTIKFDADKGFFLNGQHVLIKGVCDHHDLGALGAAINVRALQRQIELLKEMGCNAIRTSHNPPAPELLDLCDRMGMLVMDEFTDCWEIPKRPNGYNLFFKEWHEPDLRAFVRRDRNHPCVILWSVGNEIPEQGRPEGPAMASELTSIVHAEDGTRPTTFACSYTPGGYNGYEKGVDVFGYNYRPEEYAKFHATNPSIPLIGSETASTLSSRGVYSFPVYSDQPGELANFQVTSYDVYASDWATTPDVEFKGEDQNPAAAGQFVWTGFDYLGEPTPYGVDGGKPLVYSDPTNKSKAVHVQPHHLDFKAAPSRSSYFGILDLAGFKKDRFYLYQSVWRPELPMAHILPHWNWPERVGQVTPVFVYTSGDEAELFLNGKSLGRKKKGQFEYRLRWNDVVYQPGEVKAVAYKNGAHWAEEVVKTTGSAAKLALEPDRSVIQAGGLDLSYVTVRIADSAGLTVPRSHDLVHFQVTGPAEIAAVDNGDATSFDPFHATQVKAFNGLALVIIRSKAGATGKVTLRATSDALGSAETVITVQ